MRVNVYAEEMTGKVSLIHKRTEDGTFVGVRFHLELPVTVGSSQIKGPFNHRDGGDDSSAVTFWGKRELKNVLRLALELLEAREADGHMMAVTNKDRS